MDPTGRMRIQAQHGDTLFKFAQQSLPPGASHSDIMHMVSLIAMQNGLADPNKIQAGQSLSMAHSFDPNQGPPPGQGRGQGMQGGIVSNQPMSQPGIPQPAQNGPPPGHGLDQGPGQGNTFYPPLQQYDQPAGPQTPPAIGSFSPSSGQPDFSQLAEDVHPLGLPPQGYGAAALAAGAGIAGPALGLGAIGSGMLAGAGQGAAGGMFQGHEPGMQTLKDAGMGAALGGGLGAASQYGSQGLDLVRQGLGYDAVLGEGAQAFNARPPITHQPFDGMSPPTNGTINMRAPTTGLRAPSIPPLPMSPPPGQSSAGGFFKPADDTVAMLKSMSGPGKLATGLGLGSGLLAGANLGAATYNAASGKNTSGAEASKPESSKASSAPRSRSLPIKITATQRDEAPDTEADDNEDTEPSPRAARKKTSPRRRAQTSSSGVGPLAAESGRTVGRQALPSKSKFR